MFHNKRTKGEIESDLESSIKKITKKNREKEKKKWKFLYENSIKNLYIEIIHQLKISSSTTNANLVT